MEGGEWRVEGGQWRVGVYNEGKAVGEFGGGQDAERAVARVHSHVYQHPHLQRNPLLLKLT